jgi:hypothetical protein
LRKLGLFIERHRSRVHGGSVAEPARACNGSDVFILNRNLNRIPPLRA